MLRIPVYVKMNLKLSTSYDYLILFSCALFTSNYSPSVNFMKTSFSIPLNLQLRLLFVLKIPEPKGIH